MSEEIINEKSAEEILADVVKSEVAAVAEAKADKADLEGFAKTEDLPSVEGFVKSEELDEAKTAVAELTSKLEELSAVVKSAPAIIKGDKMEKFGFDWSSEEKAAETSVDITKAYNPSANVTGAPTASQQVYHSMAQMNPLRGYATIMPTTATSVNLPQVTGITAAQEANIPSSIDTSSGHAGSLASVEVIPQKWASRTIFSEEAAMDLPSLDGVVASYMGQQIGVAEASDMVGQMDGATVVEVNTGAATGLPTSIDPWADLVASLSSAYKPNAMFMMSREALAALRSTAQAGTGSDLIIDPSSGNFRLWNYEIIINDHMDAGDTAGQNPVYFGDFRMGTVIVSRQELSVSRHPDTIPGGVYFYGKTRSRGVIWDSAALRRFNVAA